MRTNHIIFLLSTVIFSCKKKLKTDLLLLQQTVNHLNE